MGRHWTETLPAAGNAPFFRDGDHLIEDEDTQAARPSPFKLLHGMFSIYFLFRGLKRAPPLALIHSSDPVMSGSAGVQRSQKVPFFLLSSSVWT